MPDIIPFADIKPDHAERVGGKGLSLGLLAAAGFPVPPGFCITAEAYRSCVSTRPPSGEPTLHDLLTNAVAEHYRKLGGGAVAVRSSATAEDGAITSFAGQQETILGVEGDEALRSAVERCWKSLHTDRAKAYRQQQKVDEAGLAMAVVVQRLVAAEVAGVLFTRDPIDPSGEHMLVEAAWGLGEAVVSGRVQPDQFKIDRRNGQVRDRKLGQKRVRITAVGEETVAAEEQARFCLNDAQLAELAELGLKVEAFYGDPRDIEWAIADGQLWLLQARPITTTSAFEREHFRRNEIEKLRQIAEPGGTVWSRYNLIEVLPSPTPMTWAVIEKLLSGAGGAGGMYRDFGFKPNPALASTCVYDLIGGRPYCNLSREPRLQARKPHFGYPFAKYKQEPRLALAPEPDSSRILGGPFRWLRWPGAIWRMLRTAQRIQKQSQRFAEEFRSSIIPAWSAEVDKAKRVDVRQLDDAALLKRFEEWERRTVVDFARHSQKPTLFADFSLKVLEQQIRKPLGAERTRAALAELSAGAHADADANLTQGLRDFADGRVDRTEFLARFGHRGAQEMELSHPRWDEEPDRIHCPATGGMALAEFPPAAERWMKIAEEAKLNSLVAKAMIPHAERLQTYLGLRETAKHHLLRGYALIRQALVELDRRHGLNGGIFYLTPAELNELIAGKDLSKAIAERKRQYAIALSLEIPPVLFSDDLEAIDRVCAPEPGTKQLDGVPLSAGVAEGPALVLLEPPETLPDADGFILVCPTTDPSWVPLFVRAKGLVMESGGILSHGAIVAREFGLPAVAGLPDVCRQLKSGQRLRVDGGRGTVAIINLA